MTGKPIHMQVKQAIRDYVADGYEIHAHFDDKDAEYTLLIHKKTLHKVRIYESGKILEANERGEYKRKETT